MQNDGTYKYIPVEQTFNNASLKLLQPIASTGATISANTGLNYFKNYNASFNSELWSGTVMNVELEQPLFAFNSLRWQRKIEPLLYE